MRSGDSEVHRLDIAVPFCFEVATLDGRAIRVHQMDRVRSLSLIIGLLVACFLLALVAGPLLVFAADQRNLFLHMVVGILIGPPLIIYLWVVRRRVVTECVLSRNQPSSPVSVQGLVRGAYVELAFPAEALTLRTQPIEVTGRASGQGLVLWRGHLCQLVSESMTLDLCAFPSAEDCETHLDLVCLAGIRRERLDKTITCIGDLRLL